MKKNLFKLATFATAMTLGMAAMTSCSDDVTMDEESAINVSSTNSQVSINRLGGYIDVPVKANGHWTAEVDMGAERRPWAAVMKKEGEGPTRLQVVVDPLSPRLQRHQRMADIIIKSDEGTQVVKLRQYVGLKDGETVSNAEGNEVFYDVWASKGLGAGFDPITGQQSSGMVLNIQGYEQLAKKNPILYKGLIRQTSNINARDEVQFVDTLEDNTVWLKAGGHLDVQWAKFKLGIDVIYDNTGKQINNVKTYNSLQKMVFLQASVDANPVRKIYSKDNTLTSEEALNMMSVGFSGQYLDIMDAYNEGDDELFEYQVENMLCAYGCVVVTGTELGGSLFISMKYDSLNISNSYTVGGKASLKLDLGSFKIGADANVDYSRTGTDIWTETHHHIQCAGGGTDELTQLTALLRSSKPTPEEANKAITDWKKSILSIVADGPDGSIISLDGKNGSKKDNTSIISFNYTPIWNLFPAKVAMKMKPLIVNYYKKMGKKTCIDLSNYGIQGIDFEESK